MTWLRHNWLAVMLVVGIGLSLWLVRHDAAVRADTDRAAAVSAVKRNKLEQRRGCARTGVQKALSAAGWLRASEARRADGNIAAANYYEGIADGTILTIAAPEGMEGGRALAQVELKLIAGRKRYVLTQQAAGLQSQGCARAYPLA